MLKPMGKKSMAHPRLDEWRSVPTAAGIGPKLPSHLRSLLVPNAAALRLQLRYQKYQDKARALLKKADASQQQESATGVAKTGGRTVKGSSMALAVALKARQEEAGLSAEQTKQSKNQPLYVRPEQHVTQSWSSTTKEWVVRSTELEGEERSEDSTSDADESPIEEEDGELMQRKVEGSVEESDRMQVDVKGRGQQGEVRVLQDKEEEEESESARQHSFVDVMEPSWLLSSIEERCAETASTLQAQRVGVNLLGRPPSSVGVHHRNLVSRIKEAAEKDDRNDLTPEDLKRVTRIFEGLKSDMFMPAVRCLGWLLTKTWRMLFHGLHVDLESLHQVRRVLEASEGDVSVVFAPTHKSHLDYLIISYLCFAYGIPLPRIAAGNNLDLPLVGSFLRANGSFFIRRSFRNDHLYKQVLEEYVHELLHDGNPVEVFIEGGRSRHGRVCKPRMGFMSMFLDYVKRSEACASNGEVAESTKKTVLLVPISLDYDKVYEVEEYANQLLGKPKEKESLAVLFRSVCDLLFLRCGHSYVRFGEPVPLTASSSLQDSAQLVSERMQNSGTITSTSIVSALLMWKRAYMTNEMLESRTVWLVEELEKRAATVAHVENDGIAVHALSILKVVTKTNGVVAPQLQYPVRALELGFYRNHLLHIFLQEMAVIGALDATLRAVSKRSTGSSFDCGVDIWLVKKETQQIWRFLRHICRHEPIDIDAYVDQFLREAIECEVDETSGKVNVDLSRWHASKLVSFVLSLHWSFMDSLWLSAQGLWSLLPVTDDDESEHTERDVVRRVQTLAKELFLRQQLIHAEALCSESIKQSLEFLVESGVICFERSRDGKARVVRFCPSASGSNSEHALEKLTREITARRKPRAFLWRQDELPRNLMREEALKLMEGAQGTQSIYAKWMVPPATTA
ncbi:hypothetical protein BBJ29_006030 [Phytophthora kernoviae]|uniref:Phospholipid/glycerol acyltransferase domain-containing protein n=1 Tax=Phytophthora kernoviae TaxID=325452 RepID=A0A3F2RH89_9STRA|nr:hypothetical protein BBJ29_006030 [Phytophthora kernoviae]RLN56775.1 hypothetical protein BBP00_00007820 [Phytophthora kernoviae]